MVAILKNTTILALGLAMVVMLTSAAPLKVRQDRLRRQAPSTGNDTLLLSNVSAGLDVLYKLSFYELLSKMNVTDVNVPEAVNNGNLTAALNITCNLYNAKENLIPNISRHTSVDFVVEKLNTRNLKDSCAWLSVVVARDHRGMVTCDEDNVNVAQICKRWISIKQFKSTSQSVQKLQQQQGTRSPCQWISDNSLSSPPLNEIYTMCQ